MLKIDEKFLEETGLAQIPTERKAGLINKIQEELEKRTGEKLVEGMTIEQLQEFEGIMNNDRTVMLNMLSKIENFREDPIYKKILEQRGVIEGNLEILNEFLSVKWVQMNRPDYRDVSRKVLEELKTEIYNMREKILSNA